MHCIQKHPLWHLLVLLWISNKEFEDTKGVIRIFKSKKDRQHHGQKDKQRSTKHTHKTKDRETLTH